MARANASGHEGTQGSERLSALLTATLAQGLLSVSRWPQKPVAQATAVLPSDPHAARPERPRLPTLSFLGWFLGSTGLSGQH